MPESHTIDLTAEDVSQLTWDELVLVMIRTDRTDGENGQIRASVIPPCTTGGCSYSSCASACDTMLLLFTR
jgi:hypothetical protein